MIEYNNMLDIKLENLVNKITQKYGLELILLFGSKADGATHKESDFDVAYLSKKNLTLEDEARLIIELAPVFGSENIDLVNLKKTPPLLFYAIFDKCQVLHAVNPLIFPSLRAYAFKKYVETKPLYEEKFRRLQAQIS